MSKPIFLLLGGNKLNNGIFNKFKHKGYRVYVIDWNECPDIRGDKHYRIDVKDYEAIISALKTDNEWSEVTFAYSSIDLAVKSVAMINRAIGLRTISDEGLRFSSSKSMMTTRWNDLGLLNRVTKSYRKYSDEICDFNSQMDLIIKPDNSASSRGITIISQGSSKEHIEMAFAKALAEASDKIVVVEEFVEGIEYTVDMLGDSYGNVSVYGISQKAHTQNACNNKIAVKLHYNSVSDDLQRKIAGVGIDCYKALGFSASFGHLEVLLKSDGTISPVEIGARSSGYIASDLVDIVSGADYIEDLIGVQHGNKVKEGLHPQTENSSLYFFYDFPEGMVIKNECSLIDFCDSKISSIYSNRANIIKGKKFNKINNDNERIGYEILKGPKSVMTINHIAEAEKQMINYMQQEVEHADI